MQNKKKIISFILALIIALSAWSVVPVGVGAAEVNTKPIAATADVAAYPDFEYDVLDDNTAEITGYTGEGGDVTIPSILGGYTVTSIGDFAFHDCTDLTSVTIPDSVTSIGWFAFSGCTGLTSVTIPDSITSIDSSAFSGCTGLKSITIPDSVTSIGDYAFYGCAGLMSITIPDSVTSIGNYAFGYYYDKAEKCKKKNDDFTIFGYTGSEAERYADNNAFSLFTPGEFVFKYTVQENGTAMIRKYIGESKSVTIPSTLDGYTVTSIGESAFSGCSSLTSVDIPDSVTSIGEHAFYGCTGLTSVIIPSSVKSIDRYAFYGCTGLTSVTIPSSVKSIDYAFGYYFDKAEGCVKKNYDFIIYGYTGSTAERYANYHGFAFVSPGESTPDEAAASFKYTVQENGTAMITKYTGKGGDVTIPSTLGGYTVAIIGSMAFSDRAGDTSVTIPDSVTSIDDYAFSGCTGLTSIDIPDSVTSIGLSAFANTAWYDNQPDGIIYAGKIAYKVKGNCPSEVVIKDGTVSISAYAFSDCKELTNVTIPDSVTSIGYYAFSGCTGLTSIDIPESVTSISGGMFNGCTGLTSVTIPDSIEWIGDWAFSNCTSLTSINIPDSVTNIGGGAFRYCTGLTSVTIPDSVTSIGGWAFYGCAGLMSITIPDTVTSIGESAFIGCTGLTSITIGNSVTSIGYRAFGYYYDESDYEQHKIDSFTIYGYEGSEAERYAKDNNFTFVPLKDKADKATGIILAVPEDTDLTVKDITSDISSKLPGNFNVLTAYDISLTKDGETVQPDNIVPVKIPCSNENAKVFRLEADGTMTDMHAKYKDGYMVFTTDHFSVYVLAEPNVKTGVTVSGTITSYIDDSDVTVKLTGADNNFTAEVKGKADYSIEAVPAGEYTLTVSKANHVTREYTVTVADADVTQDVKVCPKGDVNGDGETDIMDCSVAQRYIRELTTLDAYQIACGDVSGEGDGELDIQDVSRILRHIRELAMLY